jgi:hypothetical protein
MLPKHRTGKESCRTPNPRLVAVELVRRLRLVHCTLGDEVLLEYRFGDNLRVSAFGWEAHVKPD